MLSIENPPPDPPCPCQFPQLNSSSDERASHKLPLPEVDLPNLPLDHHTPLPNFSIRDYVFTARTKDIKKSWPFSPKNLQLCLKHGVKDVLPPFQALDTVRNRSFKGCTVEKQNISNTNFDKEPSRLDNHVVVNSSGCIDISSCRSGEEHDFPSTTTSVSQSEIDSVPDNGQSSSRLESETLLKPSVVVEAEAEAAPPVTQKTESTSRPLGKKCRLIVKFSGHSDRSSTEDIASNCTIASETMASKICPVCKTFSSSSNTTLNAHIDQCLSAESTPKWTADSKLTRHRIKPRKTRLMVDVYATALHCTLEELDRRNGTSWATVSSLPTRENQTSTELKKQRVSPIHLEDASDVGPVYIDSNGTKVRILSPFNDPPPVPKVGEDIGAVKPLKRGMGIKYISKKKKKRLVQRHQKYLKLAPQSKKFFSHKTLGSQICGGQEGYNEEGKSCEKARQMPKQKKSSDSGTLRPWVCSKRRGFIKKITSQEDHQAMRCKWHLPQDLLVENDQSVLGDYPAERNHVQKFTNLISLPGNNERIEKPFPKPQFNDRRDPSPGRKKAGNQLVGARISENVERPFLQMKQNANQLNKDSSSIRDSCMLRPPYSTRNHPSSLSKKTVYAHKNVTSNPDSSPIASTKSSRNSRAIVTKAMRFSSFRKNVLSVSSQASVTESRPSTIKKWSSLKKSRVHFMTKSQFEVDRQYALMHDHTESQFEREEITDGVSLESNTILETRQEKGLVCVSQREEALALKSSKSTPHCHGHEGGIDRFGDDFLHKIDCLESARKHVRVNGEDIVIGPSSKVFVGRSATSLSKSVDTEYYKMRNSLKAKSNSPSVVDYGGLLCGTGPPTGLTEADFVNDQEMFSADEVGDGMMEQNVDMGMELDSEAGQGNSFPEVDPIPIPGPPGSFLPSPRDMGSEDFQGNSSLTTSRVQSSPDQHDVVDGDSSDSPISATSTISNSTAGRSDFKYSEPSLVGPYAVQDKIRSGLTAASFEPSVQHTGAVPQSSSTGMEKTTFDGENFKLDKIAIEKGSLTFKNDQPCCCQKKERFSQGVALNNQESQLLRRRKMSSATVPAIGKQIGCNSNPKPANLDVRPELVPPSSCPTLESEKMVLPTIKPSAGPIPFKDSPNAGVRFLARTDCDSASPSASNPILRLMGKNLMVVNKDEDAPVQPGQVQPHARYNQASQFPTFSSVSPSNIQNQECHSFHRMVPQGCVTFGRDPHNTVSQCYDVGLSQSFRSHSDSKLPEASAQVPAGMFCDQHTDGFATFMELQEYKADYKFSSRQNGLRNRLNASPTYNTEKTIPTPDRQSKLADSLAHQVKEIIIIDDVPESESAVIGDVAKYTEGWRENQVVSSGISIPTVSFHGTSRARPFSCYQSQDHPPLNESPVVCNASFHANPMRLPNTSPVKWACTSEGSGALQRGPFTAASSSSGHLRSAALYYSPSFS